MVPSPHLGRKVERKGKEEGETHLEWGSRTILCGRKCDSFLKTSSTLHVSAEQVQQAKSVPGLGTQWKTRQDKSSSWWTSHSKGKVKYSGGGKTMWKRAGTGKWKDLWEYRGGAPNPACGHKKPSKPEEGSSKGKWWIDGRWRGQQLLECVTQTTQSQGGKESYSSTSPRGGILINSSSMFWEVAFLLTLFPAFPSLNTEGAKKMYIYLKNGKKKSCIEIVILNTYG